MKKRHASISVGCPNTIDGNGHGAFRVDEGRFICDCGKDFTKEMLEIMNEIKKSIEYTKI